MCWNPGGPLILRETHPFILLSPISWHNCPIQTIPDEPAVMLMATPPKNRIQETIPVIIPHHSDAPFLCVSIFTPHGRNPFPSSLGTRPSFAPLLLEVSDILDLDLTVAAVGLSFFSSEP